MSHSLHLYDEHAPTLYALALRITADADSAAAVLEEVFAGVGEDADFEGLVRWTRERALVRQARSAFPSVHEAEPAPRRLLDDVWISGKSVADVAAAYGLTESQIRMKLRDGMAELRRQFAGSR